MIYGVDVNLTFLVNTSSSKQREYTTETCVEDQSQGARRVRHHRSDEITKESSHAQTHERQPSDR